MSDAEKVKLLWPPDFRLSDGAGVWLALLPPFTLTCECGWSTGVDPRPYTGKENTIRAFEALVRGHEREHEDRAAAKKPLTTAERERVRILGIHRRGAWRARP